MTIPHVDIVCHNLDQSGELKRLMGVVDAASLELTMYRAQSTDSSSVSYMRGLMDRWQRFNDACANVRQRIDQIEAGHP